MQPEPDDAPVYAEHPDLAVVALLFMLSRFPWCGSTPMARSIVEHLDVIAADPRQPLSLRTAAIRIGDEWRSAAALPEAEHAIRH